MAIFALLGDGTNGEFARIVKEKYPGSYFEIIPGQIVISASKTTSREVAEYLGTKEGGLGQVVIFSIASWYGWHRKDLWDWIQAKTSDPTATSSG